MSTNNLGIFNIRGNMVVGLNIQDQDVNGTKVVRLEGRLDAVSSTMLENKLKEIQKSGKHHVALDFAKLEYLSSAGMRLLLSETKKFKSLQGSFSLFAIHENVMEIIKMAGFERILSIYPHEKEALNGAASHKH